MKTVIYKVDNRRELPGTPGVYRFVDEEGQAIYIGKSKNLRSRVNSYFQRRKEGDRPDKLLRMRRFIAFIEITRTITELEAEWLEQALIEKFRPQYNQQMKSNRRHGYLELTIGNTSWKWKVIPLDEIREIGFEQNEERWIGPFRNPNSIKERLDILHRFDWLGDWSYSPLPIAYSKNDLDTVVLWFKKILKTAKYFNQWVAQLKKRRDSNAKDLAFEQAARFQEVLESVAPVEAALLRSEFFQQDLKPFVIEKHGVYRHGYVISSGQLIRRTWQTDDLFEGEGINILKGLTDKATKCWEISNLDQEMILYRAFFKQKNRIIGCFLN